MPVRYFPSYSPTPEPRPQPHRHPEKPARPANPLGPYILIVLAMLHAAYGVLTDPIMPVFKYLLITSSAALLLRLFPSADEPPTSNSLLLTVLEIPDPRPIFVAVTHLLPQLFSRAPRTGSRAAVAARFLVVAALAVLVLLSVLDIVCFYDDVVSAVLDGPPPGKVGPWAVKS